MSDNKKLIKVALVGCGGMAANYRHIYNYSPLCKLEVLVDVNPKVAQEAAEELGVKRWGIDFSLALSSEIDMVDISTPNHHHASQAIAAMKAGKHVLIQKPLAPSVEEAEEIIRCAKTTGMTASVYMNMRDFAVYYDIQRMLENKMLGKIVSVRCRGAGRGGLEIPTGTWRQSVEKTGGGAFVQKTLHYIHLAQWLLGSKICRVTAICQNRMCPGIGGDDMTVAACEFEHGVLGTLDASYCSVNHRLEIYGTHGWISVTDNSWIEMQMEQAFIGEVIAYGEPGQVFRSQINARGMLNCAENPHEQHLAFVRAVSTHSRAPVSLEEALYDLQVAKAAYASSLHGKAVQVI